MPTPKTVTFFSNYTEYELTRQPKMATPIATGGWQISHQGVRYRFEPAVNEAGMLIGRLDVKVGQDKLVDHSGWLRPDAEEGVERDAPDAIRAHRDFGEGGNIWELGHAPGTVYPRPVDFRRDLLTATLAFDKPTIERMIGEEQATHGRVELLAEAQAAVQGILEAEAEVAEPKAKQKATA